MTPLSPLPPEKKATISCPEACPASQGGAGRGGDAVWFATKEASGGNMLETPVSAGGVQPPVPTFFTTLSL